MAQKTYAGVVLDVNDEGYLLNKNQWNKEIAREIAKEENLELTDKHFEVIAYLRDKVEKGETLTIRAIGKSGIVDIKGFYTLFPGAPLKLATKIGGLPKPVSCV
ncbi:MAG: TusE/DsrC/DsvC family sulfur relay protein [Bacteroidota bacterium]|nr:TusE/DsrC/DsvC family sulfur relay protein [Bacteroidota bacterium]